MVERVEAMERRVEDLEKMVRSRHTCRDIDVAAPAFAFASVDSRINVTSVMCLLQVESEARGLEEVQNG